MNRDDTIDLLTAIATRDLRTVGESDIAAWGHDLSDVTLDESLDAVTEFFRSEDATRRRILAADVVRWVALKRRKQTEWEHADRELTHTYTARTELYGSPGRQREPLRALPPGGLSGVDPSGGRRGESAALRELWESALLVPCAYPRCNAQVGARCLNPIHSVTTKIPHNCRTKASGHFA